RSARWPKRCTGPTGGNTRHSPDGPLVAVARARSPAPEGLGGFVVDIGIADADIPEQPVIQAHKVHAVPVPALPDQERVHRRPQLRIDGMNKTGPCTVRLGNAGPCDRLICAYLVHVSLLRDGPAGCRCPRR